MNNFCLNYSAKTQIQVMFVQKLIEPEQFSHYKIQLFAIISQTQQLIIDNSKAFEYLSYQYKLCIISSETKSIIKNFIMNKLFVKNSELLVDLDNGAKIIKLVLDGITIIQSKQEDNFTSSGSYLMYPWVNRVEASDKYLFKDKNGLALHGLYANVSRQIEEIVQYDDEAMLKVAAQVYDLEYPKFMETFKLKQNKLSIKFSLNQPIAMVPVCFGYHPYLQLGNQKLSETKFKTNIQSQVTLQQNLLPRFPFQKTKVHITPGQKYDNLFHPGSYFQIQGKTHTLRITSDMPYWQIYTPDEYRIAVQPMSFCGNIFSIYKDQDNSKLMTEGEVTIQLIRNKVE